jgi:L-threonylcarbamoyladenylate synthase
MMNSELEISRATNALLNGNLVVFPTETVYGLGADATNSKAVARIYKVKNRPKNHPIIVHISSIKYLEIWAKDIPSYALQMAKNFWPGPMTLILPRTLVAKNFITGAQNSIGLRIPSHPVALELLKDFELKGGLGVAAPSANVFGKVSPTSAEDAIIELSNRLTSEDIVLDGGHSHIGIESTIIDCTQDSPIILRPGAIDEYSINESIKNFKNTDKDLFKKIKLLRTSGMHITHYSPDAAVILSKYPEPGDGFIALSYIDTPLGVIRLASPKNNIEFAQILYSALRLADTKKIRRVFVEPPTGSDIAVAIRDRLKKCSSKNANNA